MSEDDKVVQLTSISTKEEPSPMTMQEVGDTIFEVLNHMIEVEGVPHEYIIGVLDKIKQAYLFECFTGDEE